MYRRFYDYETNRIAAAVAAGATARAEALIFPSLFPQREGKTFFRVQGNFGVYFAQGRHALIETFFWSFFEEKVHSKVPSRKKVVF